MGFPLGALGDLSDLRPHPPPLQGFYDQVANPLLVDVELQYPQDTVSALTQHSHRQHYAGSEIVVAGRIADNKRSNFKADVQARGVSCGLRTVQSLGSTQRLQTHTVPHPCLPQGASLSPRRVPPPLHVPHTHPRPEYSCTQISQAGMGPTWP